jgi:hypothetical protein
VSTVFGDNDLRCALRRQGLSVKVDDWLLVAVVAVVAARRWVYLSNNELSGPLPSTLGASSSLQCVTRILWYSVELGNESALVVCRMWTTNRGLRMSNN